MRFLLLAALCLFTTPVKADVYSVPLNGIVAVYGDFAGAGFGGSIQASFSYQATGGEFFNTYLVTDPSNLPGQVVININMNTLGQVTTISCNAFDAHCGRNNRSNPFFGIYGPEDEGVIYISSAVSVIGATPVDLHLFVNLPTGFSLTAPVVAAVPEPSTWAMMLLGFAGISLLSYSRSRKSRCPC